MAKKKILVDNTNGGNSNPPSSSSSSGSSSCFTFKNALIVFLCCSQLASLISENKVTNVFNKYMYDLTSTSTTSTTSTATGNGTTTAAATATTATTSSIAFSSSTALSAVTLLSSSQRFDYAKQRQEQQQHSKKSPNWMMAVDCASYDQSCTAYHVSHHRYEPYPFDFHFLKNQDDISPIPSFTTTLLNPQDEHNPNKFQLKYNLEDAKSGNQPYTLNKYPPKLKDTLPEQYQECINRHTNNDYSWQLNYILTQQLKPNAYFMDTVVFTISNYKYAFDMIHAFFQMNYELLTNGTRDSVFLVALDKETMELACSYGYPVLFLNGGGADGSNTKTLVQSSKFLLSRDIALAGYNYIFTEMDIWFLIDPIPMLQRSIQLNTRDGVPPDIMVSGHQDNPWAPNIGFYYVNSNPHTKDFFSQLYHILEVCPTVFDQFAFQELWRLSEPHNSEYQSRQYNDGSEGRWKEFCEQNGDGTVPPMPTFEFKTRNNLVLPGFNAQEWPLIHENTVAIHPLCGAPLRSPNGKKMVAKELGAWYGFHTSTDANADADNDDDQAGYYHRTGRQNRRYIMLDGQAWMGWDFNTPEVYHRNHILQFTITTLIAIARQTERIFILPKAFHDRLGNFLWTALDLSTLEGVVEFRETNFINNPKSWYNMEQNQPFRNVARTALTYSPKGRDELILFGQPAVDDDSKGNEEGEEEGNDNRVQTWRMDWKSNDNEHHPLDLWLYFLTSQTGYKDAELLLVNPHFLHERTHETFHNHPNAKKSPITQEIIQLHYETLKWCGDTWGRLSENWPPGRTRASDDCYGEGEHIPRRRMRQRQRRQRQRS